MQTKENIDKKKTPRDRKKAETSIRLLIFSVCESRFKKKKINNGK